MTNKNLATIIILSIIGILFSGYLTYYTFTTGFGACELFFFGMPSCFYGLIVYVLIFIFSMLLIRAGLKNKKSILLAALSLFGVAFAATLTAYIISKGPTCASLSFFGVPPCLLGLVMFAILFVLAISLTKKKL